MRRRRFQAGYRPSCASPSRRLHHDCTGSIEIKLDGFRMSARIERGRVQLLTRTGLDWSDKYPNVVAALAKARANTAYLDGELCGVGDDGLPPAAQDGFESPLVLSRLHWVEPQLVAEITYLTWTGDGLLRHTVYLGLQSDKPATQVRREVLRKG